MFVTRCGGDLTTVLGTPDGFMVIVSAPLATYTTETDTLLEALTWALTDSLPHELDPGTVITLDPREVQA